MNLYIVEDDLFHLEDTMITIEELGHTCVGHADDPFEAQEQIGELAVDAVLMDIHLHGKEAGIKLARRIKSLYQLPILFTSSDRTEEIITAAADINPVAYLTKPVNAGDLQAALILAKKNKNTSATNSPETLYVKSGNKLVKVAAADIVFAHTDTKNYCTLVTTENKKLTFRNSILGFYKLLDPAVFIQTHRSYIVNLNHIETYHETDQTIQILDHHIPVGRTFRTALYARIQIL